MRLGGPSGLLRGRGAELAVVDQALEALAGGVGGVLVVEGEAGIGKSRFVGEIGRRATERGFEVRAGAAEELELTRPFAPLARALGISGRTVDGRLAAIAGVLDGPTDRDPRGDPARPSRLFRVQEAVIELVEDWADRRPLVLAVDDLQWVDLPTAATLGALCRRTADLALLVVLAYRPVPAPPDRLLDVAEAHDATRIALGGLDAAAVGEIVAALVGAPPGPGLLALVEGARGNPFFVIELVRSLRDEGLVDIGNVSGAEVDVVGMPPTLRQTILRRVRSLSPTAVELLRGGAVLGGSGSFDLDALAALLERSPTSLHVDVVDAVAAGLLAEDGPRLAIRHDLIREAMYTDTPEAVRVSLHRRAADVLADRGEPAAIVASHLVHAHDGSLAAVRAMRRAAAELAVGDPAAAVEVLDRALAVPRLDPGERLALAADRVPLLVASGRLTEAVAAGRDVLSAGPPPEIDTRLRVELAEALVMVGDSGTAIEHLQAAHRSPGLDESRHGVLVVDTAWARLAWLDLDGAARDADAAAAWAHVHDDTRVLSLALAVQARLAGFAADFAGAVRLGEEAVAAAGRVASAPMSATRPAPELILGLSLMSADRGEEAVAVLAAGRRRAEAAGVPWAVAGFHTALIVCAFHGAGSWDDATAEAEACRTLCLGAGTRTGYLQTESMLGLIWLHRADYDRARDARERAEAELGRPGFDPVGIVWLLSLQASLAELDGDLAGAVGYMGIAFDAARRTRIQQGKLWQGPELVRLALMVGDRRQAVHVTSEVESVAERASTATAAGAAAWCAGMMSGDVTRLQEAVAAYRQTPRWLDRIRVAESAAGALAAAGRTAEAVDLLDEALAACEELGAAHDTRRILAELRRLGVHRGVRGARRRPDHGLASLTPTERKVLELVGAGLRNAEIAERLFVSRRTVETHVGRLYAKLQVRGRVALARLAAGRDLVEPDATTAR